MPVTLATARSNVRSLLNEATQVLWLDSELNEWINQGAQDVARRAETLWQEIFINVTPNVQNYPVPPDFLNAHRAEFTLSQQGTTSAQTFNLEYRGINQMDEIWGILHSLPAAWPQYFTMRGNSINGFYLMLYPAPGGAGVLTLYYYRQARPAATDTQYIDVQGGWEDIVYDYAVYKAKRKDQDPTWQEALQLYQGNLTQMINMTRRMTDQGEQVTSGIPQWPSYAYIADDRNW